MWLLLYHRGLVQALDRHLLPGTSNPVSVLSHCPQATHCCHQGPWHQTGCDKGLGTSPLVGGPGQTGLAQSVHELGKRGTNFHGFGFLMLIVTVNID